MIAAHGDDPDADSSALRRDPIYFQAPDYTHWTVHEVHDPLTANARSLIFVSTSGFRRVRAYPADWRVLDAAALWDLSWTR